MGCGTSILEGIWLDWTQPSQKDLIRPAVSRGCTKWPLELIPSQNCASVILLQEAWVCFRVVHTLDYCYTLDVCGNVFRIKLISWQSVIAESSALLLWFFSLLFAVAGLCSRQFRPVWTSGCWNHSQFLDHLLQSVFIMSCSVLRLLPSPGSCITYINCSPLLSLLLGLVLD